MDSNEWKRAILSVVARISDESYQKSAWFGEGSHISSPEELYCELFDDLMYEDFLESPEVSLTQNQRSVGIDLRDAMNEFEGSFDNPVDPIIVFDDPKWNRIRLIAKGFVDIL